MPGPTDPKGTFEFTDWKRVEAFAQVIAAMAPAATTPGVRAA